MANENETCVHRGRLFDDAKWILKAAKEMSLESSLRQRGRPKKETETGDDGV
jgi:hypothetical protein